MKGDPVTDVNDYLLSDGDRPGWLTYPPEFVALVRSGRVKLVPWHLDTARGSLITHRRFKSHLGRELVPFASRQDREDFACFEKGKGQAVMIIHDNTGPGYEDEGSYPSFADWLREAEEEAASWDP